MAAANETTSKSTNAEPLPEEQIAPLAPPISPDMPHPGEKKNGRIASLLDAFKRNQQWHDVSGYHVGDIETEFPVIIREAATVVGDVYAPKIVIHGLLNGSAISKDMQIAEGGQVWGDVFTVKLRVEEGGKVQGWISCVDESDYKTMLRNKTSDESFHFATPESPVDGQTKNKLDLIDDSKTPIEILQFLQAEAAAALAARAELEHDFETRLRETYGESADTIASFKEQVTSLRTELTTQKRQLDETEETLRRTKEQADRQSNELSGTYDLLSKQSQELAEFRDSYRELEHEFSTLLGEKEELDQTLADTLQQVDTLTTRVNNLDAAHRASLQHSAEQEDSLLRWQELAEVTEKKSKELENELEKINYQMSESSGTIKLLRQQRLDLEAELEKAIAQLDELRERNTAPIEPPQAMIDAEKKIEELEAELETLELKYGDKILWYKNEIDAVSKQLEAAKETVTAVQTQLSDAQQEREEKTAQMTKLRKQVRAQQAKIADLETAVAHNAAAFENQIEELTQEQVKIQSEKKNLQVTIRETKAQLDAYEVELQRYEEATNNQGKELAEIRVTLVERDLQLKQAKTNLKKAKAMIDKQNQFIKQMKEVTGKRIQTLQAQVAQLKSQK